MLLRRHCLAMMMLALTGWATGSHAQTSPQAWPAKPVRLVVGLAPGGLVDVLARTVRLLAQLTHQVALVQYPSTSRARVRHIEFVPLAPQRVLCVLIADSGVVEQSVAEPEGEVGEAALAELRARVNAEAAGLRLADAASVLRGLPATLPPERWNEDARARATTSRCGGRSCRRSTACRCHPRRRRQARGSRLRGARRLSPRSASPESTWRDVSARPRSRTRRSRAHGPPRGGSRPG